MDFKVILIFIIGLVFLIKGGDLFVDGACGIARRFKLPELLIGATVVSIGTTLPEVMVSAGAAIDGVSEIAYGNAIGSIICNTALIAAITIAIRPAKIERRAMAIPVIFFLISAGFYITVSYTTARFSRWVGIVMLSLFVIYMTLTVLSMKKEVELASEKRTYDNEAQPNKDERLSPWREIIEQIRGRRTSALREVIMLVVGAVLIAFGAEFLVDSATSMANALGVPQTVISLTVVALGTSLPELITAITSIVKGHSSLSIGNIIGANLFNLILVCGFSIVISPFSVPTSSVFFNRNASLVIDLPVMLGVMLILTLPALIKSKLSRWQGVTLLTIYGAFLIVQFLFCTPAM